MKKAALHNLGCKVNAYETEAMSQQLQKAGYEVVPFHEKADIYIINTCTVTNMADRKSRQMLHRAKKKNPEAVIVAAGCYVQASEEEIKKDTHIDIVIGNNKKKDLINILNAYELSNNVYNTVIDIGHTTEYEELQLETVSDHTRAYIKIQDGCNQFCSYCIIPYARGRVRSRTVESIINEVGILAKKGYKEVVLTGIHLSSYGLDRKEDGETLLDAIISVSNIEGIERIRLGSLEPRIITEEFVRAIHKIPSICPHFHLSLQSGCDETLKRMNRKYDTKEYLEKCNLLRKYFKNPAITTDVIVGFPEEDMEEFKVTEAFLEQVQFAEMHIFKYSKRKGTKAAEMEHQVTDHEKSARSEKLINLGDKLSKSYQDSFINKDVEVLVEEQEIIDDQNYYVGYTKEYMKIAVVSEEDLSNQIVRVKVTSRVNNEIMLAQM